MFWKVLCTFSLSSPLLKLPFKKLQRHFQQKLVTSKYKFALLVLLRDYSWPILSPCSVWPNYPVTIQVEKAFNPENKKFTVMSSCTPQKIEFGHFTLLFGRVWRRNLLKFKMHVLGRVRPTQFGSTNTFYPSDWDGDNVWRSTVGQTSIFSWIELDE